MGRLFVIEFDQTPETYFFMCRACNTHIAKLEEWIGLVGRPTVLKNAVNYVTDPPEHHYEDNSFEESNIRTTVAKVYCVGCNMHLGKKFLLVDPPDNPLLIREGRFLLELKKLSYWNGQIVRDLGEVLAP